MKDALDLKSKSGVHRLISALEERGFIKRLANRARALEVLKVPEMKGAVVGKAPAQPPRAANDVLDIPLHGRIAAGTPIEALQGTDTLPVPAALLGPGEHYALEVPAIDGRRDLMAITRSRHKDCDGDRGCPDQRREALKTPPQRWVIRLDPQPPVQPPTHALIRSDPGQAGGPDGEVLR